MTAPAVAASPYSRRYSRTLEGLRAIAVLFVLFHHLGFEWAQGGFIGVDIFFVLSGYLIFGLLFREWQRSERIDLADFWARRMRRLLPQMILATVAIAVLATLFWPTDYAPSVRRDALASLFYVGNIRFALTAQDYFLMDGPPSPALHLWSLGVEEQVYLLLPLIAVGLGLLARRWGGRVFVAGLVLLGLLSFLLALWASYARPVAAFYFPHYRLWEFVAGALVAVLFGAGSVHLTKRRRQLAGWTGLVLVLGAGCLTRDGSGFPAPYAIPAIIGSVLVILSTQGGGENPLLVHPVMEWIGRRSYALYIWHWPVILFLRPLFSGWVGEQWILLAISVGVAAMTYSLIENPIRKAARLTARPRRALSGFTVAIIAAAGLVHTVSALDSFRTPLSDAEIARLQAMRDILPDSYDTGCHLDNGQWELRECWFGPVEGKAVWLVGDSHAAQWLPALLAAGYRVRNLTKSSCPPVLTLMYHPGTQLDFTDCLQFNQAILESLSRQKGNPLVLTSGLTDYIGWIKTEQGPPAVDVATARRGQAQGYRAMLGAIQAAGARPVMLADTPVAVDGWWDCVISGAATCARPAAQALATSQWEIALADELGIARVDLNALICPGGSCPVRRGADLVYRDRHHLSDRFVRSLSEPLAAKLEGLEN